jgi:hypothetical protein
MTDFDPCSVAYGLKSGDLDSLSPAARKKLIRLMSRISEASYRRLPPARDGRSYLAGRES